MQIRIRYGFKKLISVHLCLGHSKPCPGCSKPCLGHSKPFLGYRKPSSGHSKPCLGHNKHCSGHSKPSLGHSKSCAGCSKSSLGHSKPCLGHSKPCPGGSKPCPTPYCMVLPLGKLNGMIPVPSSIYSASFMTTDETICGVSDVVTTRLENYKHRLQKQRYQPSSSYHYPLCTSKNTHISSARHLL